MRHSRETLRRLEDAVLRDYRPGSPDWEAINGERFYPTPDQQAKNWDKQWRDSEMSSDRDATPEEPEGGERSET